VPRIFPVSVCSDKRETKPARMTACQEGGNPVIFTLF